MGIVNVTPDSFSDGGRHADTAGAVAHARRLAAEGADIIDVGGESTRPGADEVTVAQEIDRVVPVLHGLVALRSADGRRPVALSVDTRRPEVMRAALAAGADMINDVAGFRDPAALDAVRDARCGLCVMHMKGEPRTMQQAPSYVDVVHEVAAFLGERAAALRAAGVAAERIALDPGYGFGKTLEHNAELSRRQPELLALGYPLVVGWSRKSTIGRITGRDVGERLAGSVAAAIAAVAGGASVVRVHDVAATRDALAVWETLAPAGGTVSTQGA